MYMYVSLRESMSFGLIGISSLSLLSTTYHLISLYFTIITFFIPFFTFVFACFILSFLFLGVVILIILVHRGQPYHSIHFILWHWFEDLNLRGYLTRRGSYVHQWWRRACSFLMFSHWSLIYWWQKYAHWFKKKKNKNGKNKKNKKKKNKEKKTTMICLCILTYSFGHFYHHLGFVY